MTDRFSVSQKNNLRWEYSFCKSCGKIDGDYLYSYDKKQFLDMVIQQESITKKPPFKISSNR